MPEITVVITTYNLEAYIGTCLEELFSGTYQDFDVVLVDDGSKDQTVDIVETYAQRYPGRIQKLGQSGENQKLGAEFRFH